MSKVETVSLRIFGRDLTLACPPKEKNNLIKAATLLNKELDGINDKNNALIIAGLSLNFGPFIPGCMSSPINNVKLKHSFI